MHTIKNVKILILILNIFLYETFDGSGDADRADDILSLQILVVFFLFHGGYFSYDAQKSCSRHAVLS